MFTPFPHQLRLCDFFLDGGNGGAMDPGTGKTFGTILACEADPLGGSSLVGCPTVALGVWEREIKLAAPTRSYLILTAKTLKHLRQSIDYVVVSVDLVARNYKIRQALEKFRAERVIVDECHYMKGPEAKRTRVWLLDSSALIKKAIAARRWLLSGTMAPNHAGELWSLIYSTRPDKIGGMSYEEFTDRFCRHKMVKRGPPGRRFQTRVISGTNLVRVKELRKVLAGWWMRVRKSDVLKDLPPKMFRTVPIDIGKLDTTSTRLLESPEGLKLIDAIEAGVEVDIDDETDSMSRVRSLLSEAKGKFAAEYVADLLHQGEPGVLLWFWHRHGMDAAQAEFEAQGIKTCRIDGSTPDKRRTEIENYFQHESGPPVFIGQIKAAGVAITLTKAAYEVFAECSWNPGENWQASDRAHRIGQTRGVRVDFLAIRGTPDEAVLTTIERKTRELDELEKEV